MSNEPFNQVNENLPSTRTDNPDRMPARKIAKYDMNKAGDLAKAGRDTDDQAYQSSDQPSLLSKIDNDAFIERELEAAMMGITETDLMGGEPIPKRKRGQEPLPQMKLGKVFRIHDQDVFIDLPGGIKQGVLSILSFPEGNPVIGQEVEVKIEGFDGANGVMLLSRKGSAVSNANWNTVAVGMTVEARVTGVNKGGLEVDVHGIRGFMPISQIEMFRINELEPYLNQKLVCMVAEVDVAIQNLVVSRRDILEKEKAEAKEKLWLELKEGQVREGIVRSVMPFGAFVDLGGVDGLLHISEMSWSRQIDATKLFQSGQKVKVVVLKIDPETRKVGLGFKQLEENPWDVFSRDGRAYICEGSKKAMVATIRGKLGDNQIVGVPSCNSWGGIVEKIKAAKLDRVYVILDPGANSWTMSLVKEIGENARAVFLPSKLDDGFLDYGLTSELSVSYTHLTLPTKA